MFLVFSIAGKMIAALATLLNWAIHIPVYPDKGIAVIDESWKIMRNFANMFFIIGLIIMAFATIFNISKYEARSLFPQFLLTALFINFSLVLGVLVIQGSQILSNTFLVSIGDMANRLGQDLNPSQLLPSQASIATAVSTDAAVFGTLSTLVFSVVLIFTFLFSILTAFIFVFIRIPILWALLIVSPIAWILNIFPSGQGMFKKWWHTFIGWNMFLPIYLFFLYFGLYFLSNQQSIIQSIAAEVSNAKITESLPFSLQLVFFYIMTAVFMIGGTIVAMKASMFSGTGVVGIAGWARGVAARRLGLAGLGQAAKEKQAEIKAGEGRLGRIFGGPPPGLETSRKLLGVRGGDIKAQKEFLDRSKNDFDRIENEYETGGLTVDQLRAKVQSTKGDSTEGYAYRKLAIKKGALDERQFTEALVSVKNKPLAIQELVKTAKESKFDGIKDLKSVALDPRLDSPNFTPAKRELLLNIASDNKLAAKLDTIDIAKAVSILGGENTPEAKNFLKNVGDARPDLIAQRKSAASGANIKGEMYKLINVADSKKLADMPPQVWRDLTFQNALKIKIQFLNRTNRALPEGTLFPRGTTPPVGAPPGITLPNGDTLIPGKPGSVPGGRKFKGRPGGGDKFKMQLDNATTGNGFKNGIVARL
ncbi:MAG: hypothetical protein HYT64_02710 [Candidatus Yanofskybacteria bacterium]|nr:hypothetical protein [Candidatus Yanofskybacteria bacterium]